MKEHRYLARGQLDEEVEVLIGLRGSFEMGSEDGVIPEYKIHGSIKNHTTGQS